MKDNIGKDVPIQIHQLANGYLVQPSYSYKDPSCSMSSDQEYVFNNFSDLVGFLSNHFSHEKLADDIISETHKD